MSTTKIETVYKNIKNVFVRNKNEYLKANALECELEDAVLEGDGDAEYDVLEERSDAWTQLDKKLEPALKAIKKLTKSEIEQVRALGTKDYESAIQKETQWLLLYMDDKLLEAQWNAPEERKVQEQDHSPSM
ncbi:hypothetical protein [Vibrio harveyi]|uniref:hypothetical protein n=1 Tax=Vibrio harveyi TaxID=669 RepID=UPI003CFB1C1F